ncbi:MAG: DUF4296 domain-containing protein [Bacteroidales bacterium]
MINTKIIWLLLILSLGSCYKATQAPSFDLALVLPADTMVNVLTDLHLADAIINLENRKGIPAEQLSGAYFHMVMDNHGITMERFEESVRYYAYYADQMDAVYEKVIINLSLKESQVLQK